MIETTARNAGLADLERILSSQNARKKDAVAPARQIGFEGADMWVAGMGPSGLMAGASPAQLRTTGIADSHLSERLGIPLAYLRKCREQRPELYATNLNAWLRSDPRSFFIRAFIEEGSTNPGICRAVLSDRYRRIDNWDVLWSVIEGINASGTEARIIECNLSERRMSVTVSAPTIAVYAKSLLAGYRTPESWKADPRFLEKRARAGLADSDLDTPVVFAGFTFTNSEVGDGKFAIWPRITMLQCLNGWTVAKDVLDRTHIGSRLEEGIVEYSEETKSLNLQLVKSQTVDAVRTFLDTAYVQAKIDEIEQSSNVALTNPLEQITVVGQEMTYTTEQVEGIMAHFIAGGQLTSGGVAQAVTSYAQTVDDPDIAWDLELSALLAMEAAAKAAV